MNGLERTFRLKTVSAMFMHGAESNEAELRPPSIKGMMRYWFRALAGAYYPQNTLADYEKQLFGVADSQIGSRLLVRVGPLLTSTQRRSLLPHKTRNNDDSSPAAILADKEFTITLRVLPGTSPQDAINRLEVASWSLWLAVHLGGFGQRARRGAGSLELQSITPDLPQAPTPGVRYENLPALADDLQDGLHAAREALHSWDKTLYDLRTATATTPVQPWQPPSEITFANNRIADYPVLAKSYAMIQVVELSSKQTNEQDARTDLMLELRKYKNPAFGLPLKLHNEHLGGRHASPLHLHLHPVGTEEYMVVQTALFNRYEEGLDKVPLDWDQLRKYLDDCLKEDGEEVSL